MAPKDRSDGQEAIRSGKGPSDGYKHEMKDCINDKYILNGQIVPCDSFDPRYLIEGFSVYEVIRVIGGRYLFIDDHLRRLESTRKISSLSKGPDPSELKKQLHSLVEANNHADGNVKLVINYRGARIFCFMMYYIPHRYPSAKEYSRGVRLVSRQFIRQDPHKKIWRQEFREKVGQIISSEKVWDVLLVNEEGSISEASKANIFFFRGDILYTPPVTLVLPGITRRYIFSLCEQLHIILYEETVPYSKLDSFDAVFITGTSPKVLPVSQIDHMRFPVSHELMTTLMKAYDRLISEYFFNTF